MVEELRTGKTFEMIAREMRVAVATVEVYGIDSFAANAPLDETLLARYLKLDRESFLFIKARSVKDELKDKFSYNQIRFVLACLIRDVEL